MEELEIHLHKPLRLDAVDLDGIITQGVTTLSDMSNELGVILRIRIQGNVFPVRGDFEKIRRSINALIIHLLTLSQSQARVTVSIESQEQNRKPGMSASLSASHVAVPGKQNMDKEDDSANSKEVLACRLLLEKNGGSLTVHWGEEGGLSFFVWLPLKGPRGK